MENQEQFRERLDEMADFHSRLSEIESRQVKMSQRITHIEGLQLGSHKDDDELFDNKTMGMLLILMVLPIIIPIIGEMVSKWHSSS